MTMTQQLKNIKPREVICYWEGSNISELGNGLEVTAIRNAAYDEWTEDRVYLLQKLIKTIPAQFKDKHDTSVFEYLAIGKVSPPCAQTVLERRNRNDTLSRNKGNERYVV